MKIKHLIIICLLFLTACGQNEAEPYVIDDLSEIEPYTDYIDDEHFVTAEPLLIQIDQMSNVNLDFNFLYEVNYNDAFEEIRSFRFEGTGERLVIWADQPIYNLSLIAVGNDVVNDVFGFFPEEAVATIERLDPITQAFVIDSYYGMGTLPLSGISFEDEMGTKRYFTFQQSMFDDRFHLNEFEPLEPV